MARMFRSILVSVFSVLLAIAMCTGQEQRVRGGSAASNPPHAFARKGNIEGVRNFGEVTPTLFRGAQPSQEGFEALAKMGIDIVVDGVGNRADSEGKQVGSLGMQYVAIPWHCPFPNDEVFARFLKLLQENPKKKVFVHCRLGEDRTGMMIAAYRMAVQGWTANEAMREMQQFGFSTVHLFICPRLASYEENFPKHLRSNPAFEGLHSSTPSGAK
jgi:tyrosine-protein phosphatase SIW14